MPANAEQSARTTEHTPCRVKAQEARKEKKALRAAQVEKSIEKELLARLHAGTYGDIYNFPSMQYNKALDKEAVADGEEEVEKDKAGAALGVATGGSDEDETEGEEEGEMELEYESDDVRGAVLYGSWVLCAQVRACCADV